MSEIVPLMLGLLKLCYRTLVTLQRWRGRKRWARWKASAGIKMATDWRGREDANVWCVCNPVAVFTGSKRTHMRPLRVSHRRAAGEASTHRRTHTHRMLLHNTAADPRSTSMPRLRSSDTMSLCCVDVYTSNTPLCMRGNTVALLSN